MNSQDKSFISLDKIKPGSRARIVEFRGNGSLRRRLFEMGMVPGTVITLERVAPLGDPIQVRVMGYHLSIRRRDAENIIVDFEPIGSTL